MPGEVILKLSKR